MQQADSLAGRLKPAAGNEARARVVDRTERLQHARSTGERTSSPARRASCATRSRACTTVGTPTPTKRRGSRPPPTGTSPMAMAMADPDHFSSSTTIHDRRRGCCAASP